MYFYPGTYFDYFVQGSNKVSRYALITDFIRYNSIITMISYAMTCSNCHLIFEMVPSLIVTSDISFMFWNLCVTRHYVT